MFDLVRSGIRLRAFRQSDLDNILALHNDSDVARFATSGFVIPQGEKRKDSYKENADKAEMFCVVETMITQRPSELAEPQATNFSSPQEPQFIGIAALWPMQERGHRHTTYSITLARNFWGRGYGTDITQFIVDFAFRNLNMHRISLDVIEGNDKALFIYKKCGFVLEGTQRKCHWLDGDWKDVYRMGMLIDDWIVISKGGKEATSSQ